MTTIRATFPKRIIKYHSNVSKKRVILCSNVKFKPERVNSVTAETFSIMCAFSQFQNLSLTITHSVSEENCTSSALCDHIVTVPYFLTIYPFSENSNRALGFKQTNHWDIEAIMGGTKEWLLSLHIWLPSACAAHSVSYIDNFHVRWSYIRSYIFDIQHEHSVYAIEFLLGKTPISDIYNPVLTSHNFNFTIHNTFVDMSHPPPLSSCLCLSLYLSLSLSPQSV